jgi:hypothetical protein
MILRDGWFKSNGKVIIFEPFVGAKQGHASIQYLAILAKLLLDFQDVPSVCRAALLACAMNLAIALSDASTLAKSISRWWMASTNLPI